jgi:hypothetical protein
MCALGSRVAGAEGSADAPVERAAAKGEESPAPPSSDERDRNVVRRRLQAMTRPGSYFNLFGTVMLGDGLRFNNPYRLSHELGSNAESVSVTAPYLDLALAATTGKPDGLQHGVRLGWSLSTSGVPQQTITPSYLAVVRLPRMWMVYGWAGIPVLLEPDVNFGGELALGGSWMARAGLGMTAALVADAFYGAGTRETRAALYPVLSAQIGFFVAYEVLP